MGYLFRGEIKRVVKQLISVFDKDWRSGAPAQIADPAVAMLETPAKKVAKVVAKRLDVDAKVEKALDKVIDSGKDTPFELGGRSFRECARGGSR